MLWPNVKVFGASHFSWAVVQATHEAGSQQTYSKIKGFVSEKRFSVICPLPLRVHRKRFDTKRSKCHEVRDFF